MTKVARSTPPCHQPSRILLIVDIGELCHRRRNTLAEDRLVARMLTCSIDALIARSDFNLASGVA